MKTVSCLVVVSTHSSSTINSNTKQKHNSATKVNYHPSDKEEKWWKLPLFLFRTWDCFWCTPDYWPECIRPWDMLQKIQFRKFSSVAAILHQEH